MDFHRILVPVSGTEADEEAMRLACGLAKKTKGKIWAIYVIALKRSLPLEAEVEPEINKAEDILDHIYRVAQEQDYEIETDILQARDVGPAIIDETVEHGVDLILMGAKYMVRFGLFSLGNIVPYVLKNAPCPVILYHQYIKS